MLYKSELKKVPFNPCPKLGKKELKDITLVAASSEVEISKCGKVLCVDYYSAKTKELQVRFFCDGKNHVNYVTESDEWNDNYIYGQPGEINSATTVKDLSTIKHFLKIDCNSVWLNQFGAGYSYSRQTGPLAVCNSFVKEKKRDKRWNAEQRKWNLFKKRTAWFKEPGKNLERFCDTKAFKNTYIFFSNLDKKHERNCTCGHCGKSWRTKENIKHKQSTNCPKCGQKALFIAERYQHSINDKTTVCEPIKHDNQLALRWLIVNRWYRNFKSRFSFEPDAYTFYLNENGKPKIVSYVNAMSMYYGSYNWTQKNNQVCWHEAFVYTDNLKQVFGEKIYNVDLQKVLENCKEPIDFIGLLDRLKTIPQAEYLCKLGLTKLASVMKEEDYNSGHGFENVMGVPKSLLPLYRDLSVTLPEHRIIKAAGGRFNAELLRRLREYKLGYRQNEIYDALDYMPPAALFDYIDKQATLGHYGPTGVISHLNDYYKMLDYFNVPINKSNRRPKNLKESHDKLVERYNAAIKAERDAASKKALEFVNAWFRGYQKDGFCIVLPKERADFIREGQTLSHCVGSEHYYKNHIAGTRMIFFIRRIENAEKPFYTAEIDMTSFEVLQCYGFGDKAAPKEIKDFIKSFARYAKQAIKTKGAIESANERKAS